MTIEEIKEINNRIAELEKAKNELKEEKKSLEKNLMNILRREKNLYWQNFEF